MRILHFADLHIGVENYGQTDPETGLSTRLLDFLETYDHLVSYALDSDIDLVLFSGDAYKSRDPSQTHQREFARRIARLAREGVPVFLLVGNHDLPHSIGRATALDIFPTLDVSNVYIGDRLATHRIETKSGPVQIVALPWIRRGAFLAREDMRGLTPPQINEAIQQRMTESLRLEAEALDPAVPAILAGHVSLDRATTSSEQTMMLGRDHVLLQSNVALPPFDYVALGHIHKHQVLGHNPPVVYSGSLQRIDFGEENDTKGFCVIDINPCMLPGNRVEKFDFIPVDARTFLTISVEIKEGQEDPTGEVINAIMRRAIEGAIVRVQIKLPGELEAHLREGEIQRALEKARFVASISKEVVRETRVRLGEAYSRGITPQEALQVYLESKRTSPERAKTLIEHAERLMQEE